MASKDIFGTVPLSWNQTHVPFFVEDPTPGYNEVIKGYSRVLTAEAVGNPAPTYQWKLHGTNISGATATNYTITNMVSTNAGLYTVVASNSYGSMTSEPAEVVFFDEGTQYLEDSYLTDNIFYLPMEHVAGYEYKVYGSSNLVDWSYISMGTVPFTFTNHVTTNFPYRFYKTEFIP